MIDTSNTYTGEYPCRKKTTISASKHLDTTQSYSFSLIIPNNFIISPLQLPADSSGFTCAGQLYRLRIADAGLDSTRRDQAHLFQSSHPLENWTASIVKTNSMAASYLEDMFSLKGKTAIMTGATGGLGSSMALALAKAGASIVSIELPDDPNSANLVKSISDAGSTLQAFYCDLGSAEQLRACFGQIWDAGIVPDILVNSAGIARRNKCEDATDAELDLVRTILQLLLGHLRRILMRLQLLDINVKSFYIACQEFGRRLLSLDRPGKIINIASVTAFQANKNTSIYSATKGAVVQMTKAFSNEWSSRGIQVNAICPG